MDIVIEHKSGAGQLKAMAGSTIGDPPEMEVATGRKVSFLFGPLFTIVKRLPVPVLLY